ncbi:MAG: methyltransferase domain-containing protein, partial [Halobacteriaceae archaeon]
MSKKHSKQTVLELGAGPHPRPETDIILDIVNYDPVDYVCDIGEDEWPLPDASVSRVVGDEILEHIPRDRIDHVFREADRVLEPGGAIRFQ